MFRFSIIVPVFNRPDEAEELLKSLSEQSRKNFELVLIEDGSVFPCKDSAEKYRNQIAVNYIGKPNTGRSDTRNAGMSSANGDYFVFFDSDCIIPADYFETLENYLENDFADCFGGPDKAHESFSDVQKAINYAMTSFLTTGGIRGGKINMEKFVPRTFNMGFSRKVYETVGGFNAKIDYGEDMDISARIRRSGFSIKLYHNAFVYHKRRVSLKKFFRQVYNFGKSRISTIYKLYPESLKFVHMLPAFFTLGSVCLLIMTVLSAYFLLPFAFFALLLFADSFRCSKSLKIAALSVLAGYIQLYGYGIGFINAVAEKIFRK